MNEEKHTENEGVLSRWAERRRDLQAERVYLQQRLAAIRTLERLAERQERLYEVQCLKMSEKKS